MTNLDPRLGDIGEPVPFSKSPFWKLLRDFYQEKGPQAWCAGVPNYVTSNTYLALVYAEFLIAYYQDWVAAHGQLATPLYIFEIGVGSGQFSFHLLKALERACHLQEIPQSSFRLILSDLSEKNRQSWMDHPSMRPFFEARLVDCIHYDLQDKPNFLCLNSDITLHKDDFAIPPVVISHYVLDSLPVDFFRVNNENLYATHVSLAKERFSDAKEGDIRQYHLVEKNLKIKHRYYQNEVLQSLLNSAATEIKSGYFNLPASAIKMLQTMQQVFGGRFMLSCIDKGVIDWSQYEGSSFPKIFYHGNTFSVDVNFAALDTWAEGDDSSFELLKVYCETIKWMVYGFGFQLTERSALDRFLYRYIQRNSPFDFFNLYRAMLDNSFDYPVSALLSLLSQSAWDPLLFCQMAPRLAQIIPDAALESWVTLLSAIDMMDDNYIHLADSPDFYLHLGQVLYVLEDYSRAIQYLSQSREVFGDNYKNIYAQARCYFAAGDNEQAAVLFSKAQTFRATKQVGGWVKYFKDKRKKRKQKEEPEED